MGKKAYSKNGTMAVAVFLAIAAFYLFSSGQDDGKYDFLKEPRITNMPHQKMIQVTANGDPNAVAGKAFKTLFKAFYKIPGVPKGEKQAPRARWSGDWDVKSSLTGYYALPVPAETASLPEIKPEAGYQVELTTWQYGDVAEVLHTGRYDREAPTVQRLQDFLKQQSYEIGGLHEEEYVKGPGMFFKGNPDSYRTIIRYQVKKKK